MKIFKSIKNKLVKHLPDKIVINKKEYFLEDGYNAEEKYYYYRYCNNKGIVPVVKTNISYEALSIVENSKKEAKNKLYNLLKNSKEINN